MVPLDRVVDALWPAETPADPAANVATLVSRSRRLLGDGVLVASGRAYGIADDACTVDLDEAGALMDEAAEPVGGRGARTGCRRSATGPAPPRIAACAAGRARRRLGPARTPAGRRTASAGPAPARRSSDVQRARRGSRCRRRRSGRRPVRRASRAEPDARPALARDRPQPHSRRTTTSRAGSATSSGSIPLPRPRRSISRSCARRRCPARRRRAGRARRPQRPALVGRESELATLDRLWSDAGAGVGHLVLVEGVGGIGKTRLLDATADLAEAGGGLVLRARCHPAERSLFLQPYVDALRPVLLGLGTADLAELLREHTGPWVRLLPELVELVDAPALSPRQRRRSSAAVPTTPSWQCSAGSRVVGPSSWQSTTCRTEVPPPSTCWATWPGG